MKPSVGLLGLVVAGLALGCSASAGDDAQGSTQDVTVGGRWTSPVAAGVYDGTDSVLSVFGDGTRQHVHLGMDDTLGNVCDGLVDVQDGKAVFSSNDDGACSLELQVRGQATVGAKGTKDGRDQNLVFTRRGADALAGEYDTDYAQLVIESSTEKDDATSSLKFSLYTGDQKIEHVVARAAAPAADETGRTYEANANGCNMLLNLHRSGSKFWFGYGNKDLNTDTCLLQNLTVFKPKK